MPDMLTNSDTFVFTVFVGATALYNQCITKVIK